ncbi:hypothetical protein ACFX1Z_006318 [Malus domestica]
MFTVLRPSLRQSFPLGASSSHSSVIYTPTFASAGNPKTTLLFSWLHSSTSPPPSFSSHWNLLHSNPCNWSTISCSPQGHVIDHTDPTDNKSASIVGSSSKPNNARKLQRVRCH